MQAPAVIDEVRVQKSRRSFQTAESDVVRRHYRIAKRCQRSHEPARIGIIRWGALVGKTSRAV